MSRDAASPLRHEALRQALGRALESRDRHVFRVLVSLGNLPGPRANEAVAQAFADELASHGGAAEPLLREMATLDERQAAGTSAEIFLVYVAAQTFAARILRGFDVAGGYRDLELLAGDPRKVVRDGVISALRRLATAKDGAADALVTKLAAFADGFLGAAVALEALADRAVLDRIGDHDALAQRLDEATTLVEDAPRSAERSQGRRRLLEVLAETLPSFAQRVPAVRAWLLPRLATKQPELRAAFEDVVRRLQKAGATNETLAELRAALDRSRAPLRDPTHFKGPTRGRGRKAEGRTQRR